MAVTKEQVAELYVAFFDRAPDAAGLAYWVDTSGLNIEQISQSFFDQSETQTKYPSSLSNAAFVEAIYSNMFNRAPDGDGLLYWKNELDTGNISRGNMILAIANGAKDTTATKDDTILANKTEVGLYYANAGLEDTTTASSVMSGVTADPATVVTAKKTIDDTVTTPGTSADLTTGTDALKGGDGADTFNGTEATYNLGDSIDGGKGSDTFSLKLSNVITAPSAAVTNVETVSINTVYDANTVDAVNWSGVQTYDLTSNTTNTLTINNISDVLTTVKLNKVTGAQIFDLNLNSALNTGTGDALSIEFLNSTNTATLDVEAAATGDIETLNIKSVGNGLTLGASVAATTSGAILDISGMDATLKTVTVTGSSNIKLVTSATQVTSVDASALTASLVYASSTGAASETIKGGTGADIIEVVNVASTITGGKGADKITAGNGANTISGGDDNDTIVSGNGRSTVNGDAGDDTITTGTDHDIVNGGAGNDTIIAGDGRNTVDGGAGNDTITTGIHQDTITGGDGNDTINSGNGDDIITGGAGTDAITVGTGTNTITGGAGIDTITLVAGIDTVKYAAQSDSTNTAQDLVNGFAKTVDKIDVSSIVTTSTNVALLVANFTSGAVDIAEGATYVGATTGVTHAYLNTATNALFIDLNQDNKFNAASDLVINLDAVVVAGDILV